MAMFASLGKYKNTGLLIIRIGLGILFMLHGYPKLLGGPDMWGDLGDSMKYVGITFVPVFWGLMAAVIETFGGFLFLLGLAFRPVCLLLVFTMIIASVLHLSTGDGIQGASHAIEVGAVFLGLTLVGPGKYSIDKK